MRKLWRAPRRIFPRSASAPRPSSAKPARFSAACMPATSPAKTFCSTAAPIRPRFEYCVELTLGHTCLQLFAKPPAQSQFLAALQDNLVFARTVDLERPHPAQIDDGRTMDAAEDLGIQLLLELRQALPQ